MQRRQLIKAGGASALALGAAASAKAADNKQYNWKMVMSWPKQFPGLGTSAQWFVDEVKRVTDGQVNITIYGGGELVPPFEVFNAVSQGTAEIGHGTGYYWKGMIPEAEMFSSVPFGMTAVEYTAWYNLFGGRKLQTALYKPFNVVPMLGGNTGFQMGGWFNRKIEKLEDFKGLKIRMPGVAGEVLSRVGATTVSMPGSEIFTSMQSSVIEATDWVGPWNDLAFGLYRTAKYYYGGWNEPSAGVDLLFNGDAWHALPPYLQGQIESVAHALNQHMLTEFRMNNAKSLQTLVDKHHVEVLYFSDEIMRTLKKITYEYFDEFAAKSDMAKKIMDSYRGFLTEQVKASENERHILQYRAL